jgi:hypothetical protein
MYKVSIVEDVVTPESAENGDIESSDIVEEFESSDIEEVADTLYRGGFTGEVGMCGGPGLSIERLGEDIDFQNGSITTATAFVYGLSSDDETFLRRKLRNAPHRAGVKQ